jgi:hypothetical protein
MPVTINGTTGVVTPGATIGSINGILKSTAGVVTEAVSGTDFSSGIQGAKAWVNFTGSVTLFTNQSYSQTGNVITIGTTGFGTQNLFIGQLCVVSSVSSGLLTSGTILTITNVNSGTGIVTFSSPNSLTTNGTCSWNPNLIRSSYNVSSVTKNGTGDYNVNFATAMSDLNYSIQLTNGLMITGVSRGNYVQSITTSGTQVRYYENNVLTDSNLMSVQVFGN